ncbi:alkylation response protein AidB-like acyl-CoA dehydrogenase [Paenibacillus taihuensis]|uniref:Alkylation response protein AidB-like acyl-CoA dehydrogenase n=1 Tax=Paenibacillus taihuensis TaxID=1156355 RepID=A0A3D9PXT2_9BACL|nr:acyl-CoA dehydrogenase family protein [Paenibacillus taihuensis]REE55325.1 alkylation response protein AidB-like acyl-CoA dehydrogenase [Paenibacillus taihuensis]
MDFQLTDEQQMIREMAARFAENEIARAANSLDEAELFDRNAFGAMAELGFTGLPWPEEEGGAGGGFLSFVLVLEELSRVSASLGAALWAHVYLAAWPLYTYGSGELKRHYLRALIDGTRIGSGILPGTVSGSTSLRVGLTAAQTETEEGDYVLDGVQKYVLGGTTADFFIIYAETGQSRAGRRKRYSAFVVERDCPGLVIQPVTKKLGLRSAGMAHLKFTQSRIPKRQRIGREGQGSAIAGQAAASIQYGLAAIAAGIAQGAAAAALAYAMERTQFGKPIAKHQAVAFMLADMRTAADASRLLVYQAAHREDKDGTADEGKSGMALAFAADAAVTSTIRAVQVFGGYGYIKEFAVERYMRDAKAVQICKGLEIAVPRLPRRRGGSHRHG